MKTRVLFGLVTLGLGACAGAGARPAAHPGAGASTVEVSAAVRAAVDAPARADEDRALDRGRRPAEMLSFFGVGPGQRVVELFAGGGYTAELLARVVGDGGHVWVQNNAFVLDRFARGPLEARLARLGAGHVTRIDREFDAPIPPEVQGLDAVLFVLAYHDTVWLNVDRSAMNRTIFNALRPGGVYGIVDHSAAEGSGLRDVQSLHRIEQRALVAEVTAAGFVLDGEADFLRNPRDPRDWNDSPRAAADRRGTSDRFVLRFRRP